MLIAIVVVAMLGFCVSWYTYVTEKRKKREPEFKPFCDLSDYVSCSKPMQSPYANLFFFSNALVGMVFYLVVAALAALHLAHFLLIVVAGGCLVSCVLAYLLYFKIKALCLLCTSLYLINALLLYLSIQAFMMQ